MTDTQLTAVEPTTGEFGKSRTRKEDARLITGRTRWTDNITLPGMLHLALVRSPVAHARITGIDADEARALPGVIAVYTAADLGLAEASLPNAWPVTPDQKAPQAPPLAVDTVHFAGDAVAVVIARDPATARDATELVLVDYDDLPPVLDMEEALAEGATLLHPDLGTNASAHWVFDSGEAGTGGSAKEAIAAAEKDPDAIVVRRRFRQQRLIPAFMEPRSVIVDPAASVKLGKPVKWTETRSESLLSAHHGRDQIQDITIVAKRDGTVLALDVDLLADMGAYLRLVTSGIPILGAFMFNSIYKFPAFRFACTNVFTSKTPTDAYRGAGRPEATFAIERIMDELAAELGREPLELREQNWIKHEEFPFTTVCGLEYDSGNYEAATEKAKELLGYDALRREQQERRESGDPVQLFINNTTTTEMCGLAPSRVLGSLAYGAGGWENATIRMLPTGKVEVVTGTSPHGQGHETAWSQIVADRLGVPFEDVEVLHGDTQTAHKGLDTYGSRSLVVGGEALVLAADKVIENAKPAAAHLLEADIADVEFSAGQYHVKGTDKGVSLSDIALNAWTGHNLPDEMD